MHTLSSLKEKSEKGSCRQWSRTPLDFHQPPQNLGGPTDRFLCLMDDFSTLNLLSMLPAFHRTLTKSKRDTCELGSQGEGIERVASNAVTALMRSYFITQWAVSHLTPNTKTRDICKPHSKLYSIIYAE